MPLHQAPTDGGDFALDRVSEQVLIDFFEREVAPFVHEHCHEGANPGVVYSHDGTNSDSHGAIATSGERFLWVVERFGNNMTIVDTRNNLVVDHFSLVGAVSNDPAPDLLDISPDGKFIFMSLRGPNPLTGNNPAFNNSVGSTPGVGIMRVQQGGTRGRSLLDFRSLTLSVVSGVPSRTACAF
jgi:hypothetical protein